MSEIRKGKCMFFIKDRLAGQGFCFRLAGMPILHHRDVPSVCRDYFSLRPFYGSCISWEGPEYDSG
ncbi:Uncharacterized protein dnm_004300 [Desulfonema magnum]|uniref:Uncharacterized protein n=1 Tax=Desulfonema magnum TaxID=45655 RepID=A0A975GK73_9BACT|nr:Uncharacterized protein dnm_004300 [Desulfonema magnum]